MKRPTSLQLGRDSDIIPQLLQVHCARPNPRILDCTHNQGVMWRGTGLHPLRMDINPAIHPQIVADFRALPFAAQSFDVVVFDPPHLPAAAASAHSSKQWETRYGITADAARAGDNISALFAPFLTEAARVLVPGGIILTKLADLIHNRAYQWQQVDFINAVRNQVGLTPCDMVINSASGAGGQASSTWQRIYHVRKSHCYWIVVRKGGCQCLTNEIPARDTQAQFGPLFAQGAA